MARKRKLRTRTFTVTTKAGSAADEVDHALTRIAEAVEAVCREVFEHDAGYVVSTDRLEGSVRGRRYDVSGDKFDAVISVQLVTPRDRYRSEGGGPMEIRIAAHARLEPTPHIPLFPRGAVAQILLALVGIGLLMWFGVAGTKGVLRHPSQVASVDGLGLAVTVGAIAAGVILLRRLFFWAESLPWESLGMGAVPWASKDAERWRRFGLRVREIVGSSR